MTAMILETTAAVLVMAAVVFVGIIIDEVHDAAGYRSVWIWLRNALCSARVLAGGRYDCRVEDRFLKRLGFPDPVWPCGTHKGRSRMKLASLVVVLVVVLGFLALAPIRDDVQDVILGTLGLLIFCGSMWAFGGVRKDRSE